MSNITKLEFIALNISGNNYLAWTFDAKIHFDDRVKAMIFFRHHLHKKLKTEYLTVKDRYVLWKNLKERYDHQKTIILPKYNSKIFKITFQLKLCGKSITHEDMLKKTFSTFYASNMLLQQQYRERDFKKYSELISCLLVAEQNNELFIKDHQSRPSGSTSFPEVNVVNVNDYGHSYCNQNFSNFKRIVPHHQKWKNNGSKNRLQNKTSKTNESNCHIYGMK
ncbi:hypothetical protein Pfo_001640 [Paulownia fortunei]|nr:hypothetical protein Pfo_001640 [Paulownia fortunei]